MKASTSPPLGNGDTFEPGSSTSGQLPTEEECLLMEEKESPSSSSVLEHPQHHPIESSSDSGTSPKISSNINNNNSDVDIEHKQLISPSSNHQNLRDPEAVKRISSSREVYADGGCAGTRGRVRYFILFLTVMCLTFTRSNELSFNFTVICMNSNATNLIVSFYISKFGNCGNGFASDAVYSRFRFF